MQESTSGFEVLPRLSGNRVHLEIVQQRPSQGLATVVSAALGEWVELGGVDRTFQSRRLWVKVEELAN